MKSLADTLFGRVLGWLAHQVIRHRWLFVWPQIAFFGLCVFYTCRHLEFDSNRNDLVGSGKKYHRNFLRFKEEFPAQDDLVVVVESENHEKNRQFVERLGARLEAETNLFTDIFYRGDPKMMGPKALFFFTEGELKGLRGALADYMPFIQRFTQATNLDSLFALVNTQFRTSKDETNAENNSLIKAMPVLERIVRQATASLQRSGTPPSPGVTALFGAGEEAEQEIYITFARGRIYLVTAHAKTEEQNGDAVERLRVLVALTAAEVPGLNVGITGEPVLEHDEMEQSRKDSTLASIVSLLVCALIFIYGYQETGRPLKATFCLLIGLGYTLAFTTLTVGHLNILTITFLPILIGLAIDFGVHLITRYEEELRLGKSEEDAMLKAMVYTGQGVFTGALTTAMAFLAMGLTDFKGIQEMGIICGGGMLICFIPMMTLLPVLLFRGRQNVIDHQRSADPAFRARLEGLWLKRPILVTILTVALCLLSLAQFHKVHFDYDLLNMQSKGLPAVVFEKKLISAAAEPDVPAAAALDQPMQAVEVRKPLEGGPEKSEIVNSKPKSVIFGAVVADSAEQAVELQRRLEALPTVSSVESMAPRVIGDQLEKMRLIHQVKADTAGIHFAQVDTNDVQIESLSSTLYSTFGYTGAAADYIQKDEPALAEQLLSLRAAIGRLRWSLFNGLPPAEVAKKLAAFQQALFNDVHDTFQAFQEQDDSAPLRPADLPPALRNRFIGVHGKYLLQVYPKEDVWQRDKQEKFIRELRSVDPNVTGTPIQLYEYTTLLKNSYETAAWYSLIAIVIMVLIHFRTLSAVVLALLPVAIGSIWLGGLMGLLDLPFNPANIMILPLVIGIGVTNGIHILNRFAEERNPGILSKSTGKAVFISGLTTMAGFGSLMLGKHQGIQSLGSVMSLGLATCMIASLTFLPAILSLMLRSQMPEKKQPSVDNARSTLGREEPR